MAVRIGKDNTIQIKTDVAAEILKKIKHCKYETGGIVGVNGGVITAFQFDKTHSSNRFEYCPNVDFLDQVINKKWAKENIEFAGFVHSHLNNCVISRQDIKYAGSILKMNICYNRILVGVVDLSKETNEILWYFVYRSDLKQVREISVTQMEEE